MQVVVAMVVVVVMPGSQHVVFATAKNGIGNLFEV